MRDLDPGEPPADEAVADVRRDRQVRKQRVGLEDDAEIAVRRRQIGDLLVGLEDPARRLDVEPGDRPQQRGLAAAGGPEETDELPRKYLEGDVLQRGERAELLAQPLDAQIRGAGRRGVVYGHGNESGPHLAVGEGEGRIGFAFSAQ